MSQTTLATIPKLVSQVLAVYDVDAAPLFEQAGINVGVSEANQRVEMVAMSKLWQLSVEETGNKELGLVAASLFQPTYLKSIGLAWMASVNLEDGLRRFVNSSQMINTAMQVELIEKEQELIIRYKTGAMNHTGMKVHPCAIQLGIGFFLKMFRVAAAKNIPATGVYFSFEEDAPSEEYEKYFQCPVFFGQSFNQISFSRSLLQELLPTHDPELVEMNEAAISKYIEHLNLEKTSAEVTQIITKLLPSGCPSEEQIAHDLFVSKRTLQRRLKEEGHSFSEILNSVRVTLAKQYLQTTNMPITEIAYQLGYSSPSTFARAFKNVTQVSPVAYREQH